MRFPSFSALLLGVCAGSVFADTLISARQAESSTDVLERNHARDFSSLSVRTPNGLPKRSDDEDFDSLSDTSYESTDPGALGMYKAAASSDASETMGVAGVNGCTAIFIWTNDGRLLAGHSVPGEHEIVAAQLFDLKGTSASANMIVIYSPDTEEAGYVRTALSGAGFTHAVTSREYTMVEDGSYYVFTATYSTQGSVTVTQE